MRKAPTEGSVRCPLFTNAPVGSLGGVSTFLLLLIPSIGINFLTVWLTNQEVSALIITLLKVCGYINTIVDALLLIIFIMNVTFQSIMEL
jgi:hypothetical protein